MTKLKSRPISLRIDSDLYEELNTRAEDQSKTFNAYIRENLYLIANMDSSGLNEFKHVDDQLEKMRSSMTENLGEMSKSLVSIMVLTKRLGDDIRVIGALDGITEDSEEKLQKAKEDYAALNSMIDSSIQKLEYSQKYALDHLKEVQNAGLIELNNELNNHAGTLQEKIKTLYSEIYNDLDQEQILLKKKRSEKKDNFITMANYGLFCILIGIIASIGFTYFLA